MKALRRTLSALIGTTMILYFLASPAHADASNKKRVVIYGDSLTQETQGYIAAQFDQTKVDLVWHVYGGTALCQWLPSMSAEAQIPTAAVLVEFAGNSFDVDGCMNDPSTGHAYLAGTPGWLAKYTADATQAQAIWSAAHVPTYFMQDPPLPLYGALGGNINTYPLNVLYQSLADHFIATGATVANDDGSFTLWEPCDSRDAQCDIGLTAPPPHGSNQVRNADNTHFCPATGPSSPCAVAYSPGAARFGNLEGQTVAKDLSVAPK